MHTNFVVQPLPDCASRVALVNRLSTLRGDPRAPTTLYEYGDCCITSSRSETYNRFLCKKFASELDKNYARLTLRREERDNIKDNTPGMINFIYVKSLLANGLVLHDLKASKSNSLVFNNSLAKTTEEKRQVPGHHTYEFVGGFASSSLYRMYIEKLTSCIGYAYLREHLWDQWFYPVPHTFQSVDSAIRHIDVLSAKRGGVNYYPVRKLVKGCKADMECRSVAMTELINAVVNLHLKNYRQQIEDLPNYNEVEKEHVLNSLPLSSNAGAGHSFLTMRKRNYDEFFEDHTELMTVYFDVEDTEATQEGSSVQSDDSKYTSVFSDDSDEDDSDDESEDESAAIWLASL
jgi:hypothetical protein